MHDHGIAILGHFILGYDSDTLDTYKQIADFIEENSVEMPSVGVLIPYPGTPIFQKLERGGRIIYKNWERYDTTGCNVAYWPRNMTPADLIGTVYGKIPISNNVY